MIKKKILVCGATGFMGRSTVKTITKRNDFEVYGTYFNSKPYNDPNVNLIKSDLTKIEDVKKVIRGKDIIIQFAANCTGVADIINRPYIHVTDNIIMNSLIFREAFEQNTSQVIFPSCSTMYHSSDNPLKESDFMANKIPKEYLACGQYKVYLENQCKLFAGLGKTKFTVMRHSNSYGGPYDRFDLEKSHVFGATITKIMTAKEGESINVWGTGEEERDLVYVFDVVSFIEKAIDNQKTWFELVNVGQGKSISVSNLVKKIINISGKNLTIKYDASKPTIKTKVCLDITNAKEKFGWSPQVSLDEGIKRTINWYKKNLL